MVEILHIGFSKCASTYLQYIFKNNENLNFIYKSKRFSLLDENKHDIIFDEQKINLESDEHIALPSFHPKLKVRATTTEDLKKILSKIYNYNPCCKIILVIRNHIDLLKSRYSQYVVGGGSLDIESFAEELNGFINNRDDYFQNYYYWSIKWIENLFNKHNVLVLLYEDIKIDKQKQINKISQFVGLKFENISSSIFTKRKGLSQTSLKLLSKLNRIIIKEKQGYDGKFKARIPLWLYFVLIRTIRLFDYFIPKTRIEISLNIIEKIESKFQKDNQLLSNYLNRDLDKLGYKV